MSSQCVVGRNHIREEDGGGGGGGLHSPLAKSRIQAEVMP